MREIGVQLIQSYDQKNQALDFPVFEVTISFDNESSKDFKRLFAYKDYPPVVEEIITEFKNRRPARWQDDEIEFTQILGVVVDKFYSTVYYNALFPPVGKNDHPHEQIYKVIRWASGINYLGSVALLITDEERFVFCRQYRPAMEGWRIECPRGVADRLKQEDFFSCAKRVAEKEIGMTSYSEAVNLEVMESDSAIALGSTGIYCFRGAKYDPAKIYRNQTHSKFFVNELSLAEVKHLISTNGLPCGFTRSAIMAAWANGVIQL